MAAASELPWLSDEPMLMVWLPILRLPVRVSVLPIDRDPKVLEFGTPVVGVLVRLTAVCVATVVSTRLP